MWNQIKFAEQIFIFQNLKCKLWKSKIDAFGIGIFVQQRQICFTMYQAPWSTLWTPQGSVWASLCVAHSVCTCRRSAFSTHTLCSTASRRKISTPKFLIQTKLYPEPFKQKKCWCCFSNFEFFPQTTGNTFVKHVSYSNGQWHWLNADLSMRWAVWLAMSSTVRLAMSSNPFTRATFRSAISKVCHLWTGRIQLNVFAFLRKKPIWSSNVNFSFEWCFAIKIR